MYLHAGHLYVSFVIVSVMFIVVFVLVHVCLYVCVYIYTHTYIYIYYSIRWDEQILGARSSGQQNFIQWHLPLVGPEFVTCSMSPVWHLEYCGGFWILGNIDISAM